MGGIRGQTAEGDESINNSSGPLFHISSHSLSLRRNAAMVDRKKKEGEMANSYGSRPSGLRIYRDENLPVAKKIVQVVVSTSVDTFVN